MVVLRVLSCMLSVRLSAGIGTIRRRLGCGRGIGTIRARIRTTMWVVATMVFSVNRTIRMRDDREMASLLGKNMIDSLNCGSASEAFRGNV